MKRELSFSDFYRPSCMLDHTEITRRTASETYLTSERELEKEVQNSVRDT